MPTRILLYRAPLLDVAAPLMGRPKDDLDGEDIRTHRRTERIAWAAALFMLVLGLTAGIGLNMAHERQKIAASRALASEAISHVDDRSLAMLLSIESGRIADTVESKRALLTAIQRVANAEAFLWGHTDAVTKAVFSPDGQSVLSAGWDDRIVLWNATSHQPIGQPIPCPKGLVGVAFNPDGSQFASASSGSIVLWDTNSHQPIGEPFRAKEDFRPRRLLIERRYARRKHRRLWRPPIGCVLVESRHSSANRRSDPRSQLRFQPGRFSSCGCAIWGSRPLRPSNALALSKTSHRPRQEHLFDRIQPRREHCGRGCRRQNDHSLGCCKRENPSAR